MTKDPICGMTIDIRSPFRSTQAGQAFVFCCSLHMTTFGKEPGRYAAPVRREAREGGRP